MKLIRLQLKRLKNIGQLLATVAIALVLTLNTAYSSATPLFVADLGVNTNGSDMIYKGSDVSNSNNPDVGAVQQTSLPPLPNEKQPMIDRADPSSKVLERAGQSVQDASAFLKDTANAANQRPESKMNPAIEK
ncbi:hypothetical protein [Leptolyngbya sp. FACHB-17]|uniref:hypothetical protein n=1 Tax=unclassified Leptolyngbya TaxID=2650499 RepID=UPI001680733E|nr:hypothetical protein [Leptolyngbya sp. FACHB-17]MBD2082732.1 hypothetical protein [Leptolyngbya sp. FACHB-17]